METAYPWEYRLGVNSTTDAMLVHLSTMLINIGLAVGLAIKAIVLTLGPPLEWVILLLLGTYLSTVFSDRAFDFVTWAIVQGWWSSVKVLRLGLGLQTEA